MVYPKEYPLESLDEALGDIMARKTYGKVVVDICPDLESHGHSRL